MMPTELELELLRLATEERRQAQTSDQRTELPDLDPGLFLPRSVRVTASIPTPQAAPAEVAIELSGADADWIRAELEQGNHPGVSMGTRVPNANGGDLSAVLASVFMNRDARAQAELAGVAELSTEEAGIEFDAEDLPPIRMGRQYGMNSEASQHYGPVGGRVVSQRGTDGRFRPVEGGVQPMGPERAATAPVSPQPFYPSTRLAGTVKLPPSPPRRPIDRSRIPTAIERIAGKAPFDD